VASQAQRGNSLDEAGSLPVSGRKPPSLSKVRLAPRAHHGAVLHVAGRT
jgi:hypothetical protein